MRLRRNYPVYKITLMCALALAHQTDLATSCKPLPRQKLATRT